jgi:diguanylate cyclase (GGDEF)-like protein
MQRVRAAERQTAPVRGPQLALGWIPGHVGPPRHVATVDHAATVRIARLCYLGVECLLVALYIGVPTTRTVTPVVAGLLTVGAIWLGVALLQPQRWAGWVILSLGAAMVSTIVAVFASIGQLGPPAETFPAPNELLYTFALPVLTTALIVLGRPPMRSRNLGMLLDVAGISLTNVLIVFVLMLHPAIAQQGLSTWARTITFVNFLGTCVVFTAAVRMILDWYGNAALRWLGTGIFSFFLAGIIYAGQLQSGVVRAGGASDLAFLLFGACCGAAALTPSMAVVWSDRRGRGRPSSVGVPALTLCVGALSAALLYEANIGPVNSGVAFAAAFAGLAAIAVIRLSLSVGDHRKRTTQAAAMGLASRELVAAITEDDVLAALHTALRSMVGEEAGRFGVSIVAGHRPQSPDGLTIPLRSDSARRGAERALRFTAPVPDLVELTPMLEVMTDHAASALERIALATRIRAEEQTSRDATLISRGSLIEYATPAAFGLFGRDVRGRRVEDVIEIEHWLHDGLDDPSGDIDGWEGHIRRPDGSTVTVFVRERDLTNDPYVAGLVTTVRDITVERARQRDLAYRASHDPLTGLANRETFQLRLGATPVLAGTAQAVLFVDLDDFKKINDTYGHHVGDRVLEIAARRIESCLRADDLAARLGGDEFAVLLSYVPDEPAAWAIAQRITDTLSAEAVIDGMTLTCRASVGLAFGRPVVSLAELREADVALYAAKAAGKGRWSQYQHSA